MKTRIHPIAIIVLFVVSCSKNVKTDANGTLHSTHAKQINAPVIDSIYCDDLNLDGYQDTIFVSASTTVKTDSSGYLSDSSGRQNGVFYNHIRFSAGWPDLRIENSVRTTIVKAGDLNLDGNSELLIASGWFLGSRKQVFLYTLKKDSWEVAARIQCRLNGKNPSEELRDLLMQKNGKWYLQGINAEKGDKPYAVAVQL